jgi:hypothetical protein
VSRLVDHQTGRRRLADGNDVVVIVEASDVIPGAE